MRGFLHCVLTITPQMDIETSQLKASELGKVVYFYGIHPKVEPGVKRQADQLVSKFQACDIDQTHIHHHETPLICWSTASLFLRSGVDASHYPTVSCST